MTAHDQVGLLRRPDLTVSYYTLTGVAIGEPARHTFAARASAAADAGFTALALAPEELERTRAAGRDLGELVATAAANGLGVTELEPLRGWDEDDAPTGGSDDERRIYELAAAFGCRRVNTIQTVNDAVDPAVVAERFAAVCARATAYDLTIALEPRANSTVGSPAAAAELIAASGASNARIAIDAYHFHRGGLTLAVLDHLPPKLIASIQLNDMHARPVGTPVEDALQHRLSPGDGDIDLAGWLHGLADRGIDVPISVEVLSRDFNLLPVNVAARRAADGARAALTAARELADVS